MLTKPLIDNLKLHSGQIIFDSENKFQKKEMYGASSACTAVDSWFDFLVADTVLFIPWLIWNAFDSANHSASDE